MKIPMKNVFWNITLHPPAHFILTWCYIEMIQYWNREFFHFSLFLLPSLCLRIYEGVAATDAAAAVDDDETDTENWKMPSGVNFSLSFDVVVIEFLTSFCGLLILSHSLR